MSEFSKQLLSWFQHSGRKTLPWQRDLDPYKVWVSEIMLQQTQVKTVIPYFERFIVKFPSVNDLAAASADQVLNEWAGLGYYARARNLHKMAEILVSKYKGNFPKDLKTLQSLPGLGRSTASAILAISFGKIYPILDGNVKRVLTRYLGISGYPNDKKIEAVLWAAAEELMPKTKIGAYTQAIMDLGAIICTPKNPTCLFCPVQKQCVAYLTNRINELPTPKPSVAYPTKKAYFLILTDGHQLYLEKRPNKGIWGGLWSLPEFTSLNDIQTWCNLRKLKPQILAERPHLFTHYRLLFTPVLVKHLPSQRPRSEEGVGASVAFKDLEHYGLPAPIKRLLDELGDGLIA